MALYSGWFLGFMLDHPDVKGRHWCQLSKTDILAVTQHLRREDAIAYVATKKKINVVEAGEIVEFVFQLKEGVVNV